MKPAQYMITDRKSTRLNSSHLVISYAVFCLKKKNTCSESWRRSADQTSAVAGLGHHLHPHYGLAGVLSLGHPRTSTSPVPASLFFFFDGGPARKFPSFSPTPLSPH